MINTVVYSTVLKGFAVSKRIDKVLAVYKAGSFRCCLELLETNSVQNFQDIKRAVEALENSKGNHSV